jgi:hypothetical protein
MTRTAVKWSGRILDNQGVVVPETGVGPPNVDAFSLYYGQSVTFGGWTPVEYDNLAGLLGAATFGDNVTADMLAAGDVIAFEQNGDSPAQSGGWESCIWEFADSQHSVSVHWSEATLDGSIGGVPVPRDPHVIANGSIAGSAYAAFFGIPQAKVIRQQVISFLIMRVRDEIDVTGAAFRLTMRGAQQSATEPYATPDPDAVGVLLHSPADAADPVLREFLRPFGEFGPATLFWNDSFAQSPWSRPDAPLLIFADNILPAAAVSFHGGPIGTGLPVQLVYWGEWWNTPDGAARAALLSGRVRALLASDYFSELVQYGVRRPTWRGDLVVTQPSAPAAFTTSKDTRKVTDLIESLIDDDVFPDPDDGRIAFVVLMPAGFTQSIGANGAHTYGTDYDFPFDTDKFWVAWVRYFDPTSGEDPESTIQTASHELVEMFTDPESDGWFARPASTGEVSDAGVSGTVKQTAWVNGAHVQSYWSNRHAATVLPIDRDYAARISARTALESERVLDAGTFRPDPGELAFCHLIPECCIPDRDYSWQLVGRDELVVLRVETARYREPVVAWTVQGGAITGSGTLTVRLSSVQQFHGRDPSFADADVRVNYEVSDAGLELRTAATAANFDLTVGCQVTDASVTGNVRVNVVATPSIAIGFAGAEVRLDPTYTAAHDACGTAARAFFTSHEPPLQHTPLPANLSN